MEGAGGFDSYCLSRDAGVANVGVENLPDSFPTRTSDLDYNLNRPNGYICLESCK